MDGVIVRELSQFHDDRGWLVETFRKDETAFSPVMSYVSMTRPGISRGPHEHMQQSDYFCFFSDFRLYLWDNRKGSATYQQHLTFDLCGKPHIAIVPPGVVHAYKNIGQTEGLVINMPDMLYKGEGKTLPVDEVRYENDSQSLYRID